MLLPVEIIFCLYKNLNYTCLIHGCNKNPVRD
jgi:hypothetical protein